MKRVIIGCVITIAPLSCGAHRRHLVWRLPADEDRRGDDVAGGRGRPAVGVADERQVARLDHFDRQLLERPAPAEVPRLLVDVGEPRGGESIAREVGGAPERGRVGEPRTDLGGERLEDRRDLRVLQPLGADLREGGIGRGLRGEQSTGAENDRQRERLRS